MSFQDVLFYFIYMIFEKSSIEKPYSQNLLCKWNSTKTWVFYWGWPVDIYMVTYKVVC